jgi:hypothetical protein
MPQGRRRLSGKCQLVQAGRLQPVVAIASNPRWTCGVIVDGQLSCQQGEQTLPCMRLLQLGRYVVLSAPFEQRKWL